MTISNTTFTGNSNQGGGGAIGNSGSLSVTSSTFADNSAISSDIFNGISDIPNPGDGGGIDNGGTLSITNTTFNGNSASNGNTDQGGSGGAIFNSGTLSVTQVTMADNSVSGDGSAGGGIAISAGSNIAVMSIDSIFDNPEGGNISGGSASNFQSLGHNLFSDDPGVPLDPTDLINSIRSRSAGRERRSHANHGPAPRQPRHRRRDCCFRRDHRSTGNHQAPGERPDIGAFESRGFILTIVSGQDQRTPVGSAFAAPLVVAVVSPFGEPVTGGLVTFTAPVTGASADFVSATAIIGSDGQASATALANGFSGNYSVTIAAAGASSTVAVSLTNNEDPTIVSLQRFGVHYYPTRLVLTFSEPMNATPADKLDNYQLAVAVPDHRHGVEDGRSIRIRRALYDAANQTVTLWPIRRLPLRRTFLLTVKGTPPGGLTNASGTFLNAPVPDNQAAIISGSSTGSRWLSKPDSTTGQGKASMLRSSDGFKLDQSVRVFGMAGSVQTAR